MERVLLKSVQKGTPFIVVAEAEKQKAYVRVVDGEEQSVSRFDVGGKEIQKGLKGFIYGEKRRMATGRYTTHLLHIGRPGKRGYRTNIP